MKTCRTCSLEKDAVDFYAHRNSCKTCTIKRNRANTLKNREGYLAYQRLYQKTKGREQRSTRFIWIDQVKAVPCEDCKESFPPECMDFDHIDPSTKKFNVSQAAVSGRSVSSVKEEIAKCRLICANCHRIRTALQQRRGCRIPHEGV